MRKLVILAALACLVLPQQSRGEEAITNTVLLAVLGGATLYGIAKGAEIGVETWCYFFPNAFLKYRMVSKDMHLRQEIENLKKQCMPGTENNDIDQQIQQLQQQRDTISEHFPTDYKLKYLSEKSFYLNKKILDEAIAKGGAVTIHGREITHEEAQVASIESIKTIIGHEESMNGTADRHNPSTQVAAALIDPAISSACMTLGQKKTASIPPILMHDNSSYSSHNPMDYDEEQF